MPAPQPTDGLLSIGTGIRQRAAAIRLACFDVDGTLTDGRLWLDAEGRELKAFHIHDGMGLRLLEAHGVRVALVTARHSAVAEARGRELRLSEVHIGIKDKRALLEQLCAKYGHTPTEAAMMGDDLVDLGAMAIAGLAVAPANAHAAVKARAHWCTRFGGGEGAARELADLLLEAQGKADAALAGFLR
ncbi:MAG TPA: phenylphosphate carboxylase subunit delta [Xanthomonadaceae bacterium]|jgi:3-deoxy-D-manno-octulosonate 8-phosphate phosphatase (KDO 8-P phosphatase)|nr:phenylphosphate carboxylase subunit delta [Xanthomonadaceae bacterium]